MPRRRPSALRRPTPTHTQIPGVPIATSHALDRLGSRGPNSAAVADALAQWQRIAALPAKDLMGPACDWTEFIGPYARDRLEAALQILPGRRSRELRALVERADVRFLAKTVQDPSSNRWQPWWHRR